jgi:XTP/dITP diphosphohydrolase
MDWSTLKSSKKLLLGTTNRKKLIELSAHLQPRGFDLLTLADMPSFIDVEETGTTFLENARLKAEGISRVIDGWVLSDDSGLEVDALGGAPGVWSSSFGGEEGNHALNNARLLREMEGQADRLARFRCTMVLAQGGSGVVLTTPRGG